MPTYSQNETIMLTMIISQIKNRKIRKRLNFSIVFGLFEFNMTNFTLWLLFYFYFRNLFM